MRQVDYAEMTPEDHALGLWAWKDEELVNSGDIDETIECELEDINLADWPETIVVSGYVRMKIDEGILDPDHVIEYMVERLDEDYGDPDGTIWEPTEKVKAAAQSFMDALREDYKVWACEAVLDVKVPVRGWVERHRPDWLKEE